MKYYEEKSWKDMYERSKTFQRSEKNNKNSNSI